MTTPATRGTIVDFGEHVPGAKKHRTTAYLDKMRAPSQGRETSLGTLWPSPNYATLAAEGCDQRALAFVHAVRDLAPGVPRWPIEKPRWHDGMIALRGIAADVIDKGWSEDIPNRMESRSDEVFYDLVRRHFQGWERQMALYEKCGHEIPLTRFRVNKYQDDKKRVFFNVGRKTNTQGHDSIWLAMGVREQDRGATVEAAVDSFAKGPYRTILAMRAETGKGPSSKRGKTKPEAQAGVKGVSIYTGGRYGDPCPFRIGFRVGGSKPIDMFAFSSWTKAHEWLYDHKDEVAERLRQMCAPPTHRSTTAGDFENTTAKPITEAEFQNEFNPAAFSSGSGSTNPNGGRDSRSRPSLCEPWPKSPEYHRRTYSSEEPSRSHSGRVVNGERRRTTSPPTGSSTSRRSAARVRSLMNGGTLSIITWDRGMASAGTCRSRRRPQCRAMW